MQRKNKTRQVVRSKNPNASGEILMIADQYDTAKDIAIFSKTEGGKVLIVASLKDVVNTVYELTGKYKTASHPELVSLCATLEARLSLYEVLSKSDSKAESLKKDLEEYMNTTEE